MPKTQDKKRNQDLGIFYTPQEIVNFIFQILKIWKDKEDKEAKRWQSRKPRPHYPSVIDPACGEGVFLKSAITTGFTGEDPRFKAPYVWGIDLDKSVVDRWEQISLLSLFHGDKVKMNNHFYHQNGLLPLEEKHLMYKNADEGLRVFDAVVGNPPYGGLGLESITPELEKALFEYSVWKRSIRKNTMLDSDQLGLLSMQIIDSKEKDRIIKFPIEILFLDRFIQLAKPGGWIVIIIPDGILTSSNSHYVREFLSDRTKVEAIISLPREAFKSMGTNAKTSILFLRKLKDKEKLEKDYRMFLASVEKINQNNFDTIVKSYERVYNLKESHMNTSDSVQITKDKAGNEAVMVRVDKTLKNMLEEKPFSRLDVNYWHPKWDNIIQDFRSRSVKKRFLGEFTNDDNWLISTDHVRASKGEKEASNLPVEYYSPAGFLFTGYDTSNIPRCSENAFNRMRRARPIKDDLLLGGFGMGPTGKSLIIWHTPSVKAIVGNIFILRVKNFYDPYVLDVFFKSNYGQAQFSKYKTGVAFNSLSNDEIKYLLVPEFNAGIINSIHSEYIKMIKIHDTAMEAKLKGNNRIYKENIEIANKMLKDLITKTEEVIRGERSNVI